MAQNKSGTVAVVVGAAQRGIGYEYCIILLNRGAKVVFGDIETEKGDEVEKELRHKFGADFATFVKCDITKEEDVKALFKRAFDTHGRVDFALNNTAVINEFLWRQCIDVNIVGMILFTEEAIRCMSKANGCVGGLIVHTCSGAGLAPMHFYPVYVASKYAMIGYVRSWAMDYHYERTGIRLNLLCPYGTDSSFIRNMDTADRLYDAPTHHKACTESPISKPSEVAALLNQILDDETMNGSALQIRAGKGSCHVTFRDVVWDEAPNPS